MSQAGAQMTARAARRAERLLKRRNLDQYGIPNFQHFVEQRGGVLQRKPIATVGINVGLYCNLNCNHCHVEAGPTRTEWIDRKTAERILHVTSNTKTVKTIDLTGGAPELNPQFRFLVQEAYKMGYNITDRCNLTCLFEPGQEDLPEFLMEHKCRIVASLPCYLGDNVDGQRGTGVFGQSIRALQKFNEMGYGIDDDKILDLVYNPTGIHLAPNPKTLEEAYRRELGNNFGIKFTSLKCFNNMPVKRYADYLYKRGELENYLNMLVDGFDMNNVSNLMCQDMVNIRYDGQIYDCDFNQQLDIKINDPVKGRTIWEIESFDEIRDDAIGCAGAHCFGCTAGEGSR